MEWELGPVVRSEPESGQRAGPVRVELERELRPVVPSEPESGQRAGRVRIESDRGAGTVLAMVIILVVVAGIWVAGALSAGVTARRSAAAAADLAALAVAGRVNQGSGDPCAAGDRVAAANGGRMVDCAIFGYDAEVVVEVTMPDGPYGWVPDGRRRARAGPTGHGPG